MIDAVRHVEERHADRRFPGSPLAANAGTIASRKGKRDRGAHALAETSVAAALCA